MVTCVCVTNVDVGDDECVALEALDHRLHNIWDGRHGVFHGNGGVENESFKMRFRILGFVDYGTELTTFGMAAAARFTSMAGKQMSCSKSCSEFDILFTSRQNWPLLGNP